ncbi:MAG: methyltransferase domain-containing protein [Polyangiaceae bacterium]|nr:methyltransferase domain-containing protein [Polyangiaceae bacterium]
MEHTSPNADQIKHWNEIAGPAWVAAHEMITAQIRPLGEIAMARAAFAPGERVIDVGCGCGETTLEIARRVGASGEVLGIDVSAPMLERAVQAAAGTPCARFEAADAQTIDLPAGSFDALYSRFGVMFFSDPRAAFANLRRALRPGARLVFVCWRSAMENPWMLTPMRAVMQHIPFQPPDPSAPGPFAFADGGKVRGILEGAGFSGVALEPVDMPLTVGGPGADLEAVVGFLLRMGPARAAVAGAPEEARAAAARAVLDAVEPFRTGEGVRMPSAAWLVTAASP